MRMSFHFYNPTRIVFGSGTLNELGNQALPGKKALLLMSCGKSAKVSGAYDRTLEQLKKAGVEVAEFAKVMENPLKDMVMEGAAFARDNGCDFIVALGGGAVLDSATAISAMASNGVNILSETIALSAIRNIAMYLPRAVRDGHDLEAREHIAYGSTMAGMTMQLTSTTAQHSMEHSMSAYHHNLPHGAGLIMISKAFAEFFMERHACDAQFVKMARAMGMERADKPQDFITALVALQEACGAADLNMSDYGFTPDEFMTLAKGARSMQGGLFAANPCEMTDEDCASIFEKSYR